MRTILACLALLLLPLAMNACGGDDSSSPDMSAVDMAAGPDLTAGMNSCSKIITCAAGCSSNMTCEQACLDNGTTAGKTKFQAMFDCGFAQCTVANDGGSPACSSKTDTSMGCQTCVQNSITSSACSSTFAACLSDK